MPETTKPETANGGRVALTGPVRPNTTLAEIMDSQAHRKSVDGAMGHPDTIWHIDFGSYGHVTLREDEAEYGKFLGGTVAVYKIVA